MKKIAGIVIIFVIMLGLTGCTDTVSTDEDGNAKTEFSISETATVNDTKVTINSVTRIDNECSWEWEGECQSYTEPDNDYFLLIDLTIENTGTDELAISSMMSFDLRDSNGERGSYALLTESITSQLDGTLMAGDTLKGQIAFDVKESDSYNFYYLDSLVDDQIKFIINQSDITQ